MITTTNNRASFLAKDHASDMLPHGRDLKGVRWGGTSDWVDVEARANVVDDDVLSCLINAGISTVIVVIVSSYFLGARTRENKHCTFNRSGMLLRRRLSIPGESGSVCQPRV